MYDIIGDVHGQAILLRNLLLKLGYSKTADGYSHPERKAIFVGDFINRGPDIRGTLKIVRQMVDNGNALAILGNHEINALLYHMKTPDKVPLLPTRGKRSASVTETTREFKNNPEEWKDYRKWLRTLPFFLELDGIRIVHACWDDKNIETLKQLLPQGKIPKQVLRDLVMDHTSALSQSILQTIRGIHHILPPDIRIFDNRHKIHHFYRIRWWVYPEGMTFQDWSFESKFRMPAYSIPPELIPDLKPYPEDAPLVFFGHYCRWNGPYVISRNLCCVDACVMGTKRLAAYRWDGEAALDQAKLVFVK